MRVHTAFIPVFFFTVFMVCNVSAQPIGIDKNDLFRQAGQNIVMAYDSAPPQALDITTAGANVSWDFSQLAADYSDTMQFINPASTPFGSLFPGATLCMYGRGEGAGSSGFAYTNKTYQYVSLGDSTATYYGLVDNSDQFAVAYLDFIPPYATSYNLSYLDTFRYPSFSRLVVVNSLSPTDTFMADTYKISSDTVDSWGTLKLPGGNTFDVLRMKSVERDSIIYRYFMGGSWYNLPSQIVENINYTWLAKNIGFALMQISSRNDTLVSAIYAHQGMATAAGEADEPAIEIYPNPNNGNFNLVVNNNNSAVLFSQLLNMEGKLICRYSNEISGNNLRQSFDLSGVSAGVYFLHIVLNDKVVKKKIVIAR